MQPIVDSQSRPYLERKQGKPSTKRSYECELKVYILRALGVMRITDVAPLHVEKLPAIATGRRFIPEDSSQFRETAAEHLLARGGQRSHSEVSGSQPSQPSRDSIREISVSPEQLKLIVDSVPGTHQPVPACDADLARR